MDRNCFTYFLKWQDGTMYYGCRYAKGCSPKDLWNTYFTSSDYLPNEEPVIKKITRTFGTDVLRCRNHEAKFLQRVNAVKSSKWHNRSDIINFFHSGSHSEETKMKIKEKRKNQILTDERNKKVSASLRGRKLTEEHRQKISQSTKGRVGGRLGKKASKETKERISQSNKGKTSAIRETYWWNNGVTNKRSKDCPGPNFVKGFKCNRTKKPNISELKWWINDKGERTRAKEKPGPNWKKGMKL